MFGAIRRIFMAFVIFFITIIRVFSIVSPLCPNLSVWFDKIGYYFEDYGVVGVHHVGILCENLERSLHFYQNILGMFLSLTR